MWVYIKYGHDDENYLLPANSRGSKYWRSQKEPITKKGHRPQKNTKMHKYQSAGTDFFLRYSLAQGMQLMLFKAPSWNSSSTCRSGLMSTNVLVYKMPVTLAWYILNPSCADSLNTKWWRSKKESGRKYILMKSHKRACLARFGKDSIRGGETKTAEICLFKPSSIIEIHFQLEEKKVLVIPHSLKSVKLPLLCCCCCCCTVVVDQRPFQRISTSKKTSLGTIWIKYLLLVKLSAHLTFLQMHNM